MSDGGGPADGMSLRDALVVSMMQGYFGTDGASQDCSPETKRIAQRVAARAYEVADAMIAEGKK